LLAFEIEESSLDGKPTFPSGTGIVKQPPHGEPQKQHGESSQSNKQRATSAAQAVASNEIQHGKLEQLRLNIGELVRLSLLLARVVDSVQVLRRPFLHGKRQRMMMILHTAAFTVLEQAVISVAYFNDDEDIELIERANQAILWFTASCRTTTPRSFPGTNFYT